MDLLAAATAAPAAADGDGVTCDECEQLPARVECEDCGLAYCEPCDAHRHRKGKLRFHQRQSVLLPQGSETQLASQHAPDVQQGAAGWTVQQVGEWLRALDLELFAPTAAALTVDGALLLSGRADELFETHCGGVARGSRKKLQREIQKLRAEQPDAAAGSSSGAASASKANVLAPARNVMLDGESGQQQMQQPSSARRLGVNLRVNVNAAPAAPEQQSFSPVTALRSRIMHGQVDETKGRVNRRRSAMPGLLLSPKPSVAAVQDAPSTIGIGSTAIAAAAVAAASQSEQPKRSKSVLFAPSQLRIDVKENALLVPTASAVDSGDGAAWPQRQETRPGGRTDLRSIRQALGGLDLDILQVKNEERSVEASFDFSAEGRLQTQGFEINVRCSVVSVFFFFFFSLYHSLSWPNALSLSL